MQRLVKILAFGLVSGISISQAATLKSVYTDLTDKACKTLESDSSGSGWYKGQCQGINGYKLILTEADKAIALKLDRMRWCRTLAT